MMVADIEGLETMDVSDFPVRDGDIKFVGGDQELRTSSLIRHWPIRGEGHVHFLGESKRSLPQPQDSLSDAGEAINDFWSISGNFIHRHHVEPRVKLYSPREESFPIPLKFVDVTRIAHTNLDVKQEKRIDDYWNIAGSRDLSDSWTGFTQLLYWKKNLQTDTCGPWGRLTKRQVTSMADHLWPELWEKFWKKRSPEGEAEMVKWKNGKSIMPENCEENLFHWPWGQGIQRYHQECSQEIGNATGSRNALQDLQEKQAWRDP